MESKIYLGYFPHSFISSIRCTLSIYCTLSVVFYPSKVSFPLGAIPFLIIMRLSRLFIDQPLAVGQEIILPKESAHYLLNVLRLRAGASVILFNGQGGEYVARLIAATKKAAQLQLIEYKAIERESALQLTLVQAISRPDHMDYTLQKAVELGVQCIVPVTTERSPPLDKTKISKREQHWRKIIISACEQCGRNRLPQLYNVQPLSAWLVEPLQGSCMVLSPTGKSSLYEAIKLQPLTDTIAKSDSIGCLNQLQLLTDTIAKSDSIGCLNQLQPLTDTIAKSDSIGYPNQVTILIGAEGGLSEAEIQQAMQAGYLDICLGQRILRTETAAVAVLAVCQALWGDLC